MVIVTAGTLTEEILYPLRDMHERLATTDSK
jgi:hypothetical protein